MSKDALDGLDAKPPTGASTSPGFAGSSTGQVPQAAPSYGQGYVADPYGQGYPQPSYAARPNNDFANGVLTGAVLDGMASRRETGVPSPRGETRDARPAGGETRDARPAGGHGFLTFLVVVLLLAALGALAYYVWSRRMFGPDAKPPSPYDAEPPADGPPGAAFTVGGRLKLSSVPFVLATASGSVVPDLSGAHVVEQVGRFSVYGVPVERAYFDDGKAFVERAVDPRHPGTPQVRVYGLEDETFPDDASDWAFFMGSDGSNGVPACEPYVGQPAVTIEATKHDYDRVWGGGNGVARPVTVVEKVRDRDGRREEREHALMQYSRGLGTGDGASSEFLYIGRVTEGDEASIKVWVGLDVAAGGLDVI